MLSRGSTSSNHDARPSSPTLQNHGPRVPSESVWQNNGPPRGTQQEHTSTPNNRNSLDDQATHEPDQSNSNVNFHMKAFDLMSVSLSQGLDNPELYVYIFNQFLTHNGYPEINVPKEAFIKKTYQLSFTTYCH